MVASGGCSAFNPTPIEIHNPLSKYAPLRHRHLALLPDEGKLREWREKARVLTGFCQSVSCLSFFTKDFSWPPYDFPIADGDGYDDMLLAYLAAGKDITQLIFNFSRYQPVDLVS